MARKRYDPLEISVTLQRTLFEDAGETAFAILRNLVFASPVGDPENWQNPDSAPAGYVGGHFRRNWLVSLGGINAAEIAGADEPAASTLARGRAQIDTWSATAKFNTQLVIQNNVPYAERLAQGHSLQASAGWVDAEIDLALRFPGGTRDLR
jgi:hypothetical protein